MNQKQFKEKLRRYLSTSLFEDGMNNAAQDLVVEMFEIDSKFVIKYMSKMWDESPDVYECEQVLLLIKRLPGGIKELERIAFEAMGNKKHASIIDLGIKCFECWGKCTDMDRFKSYDYSKIKWLDEYYKEVIEYLEKKSERI